MEREYNSEKEFLKNYNPDIYEKPSVTVDLLIAGISTVESENYRKANEKKFSILLVKRKNYPYKDCWCLPGGFIKMDENLDDAAKRVLATETNLKNIYLEQLYTFSDINRDPRMRVISTAYVALINKNKLKYKLANEVSWFDVHLTESKNQVNVDLFNGKEALSFTAEKRKIHTTNNQYKFTIKDNKQIAFDHSLVILKGIERLRNKIEYTDIAFNMLPEYFTLGELQKVYEVILGKKLIAPDFRRMIINKIEKTDKSSEGKGHRPSALYKYKNYM